MRMPRRLGSGGAPAVGRLLGDGLAEAGQVGVGVVGPGAGGVDHQVEDDRAEAGQKGQARLDLIE
jgi:hypothetical protein